MKGSIKVGMPCHHPAWPVKCSLCGKKADGFNVHVPTGIKLDPEDGQLKRMAWGMSGTACIRCKSITMPLYFEDAPQGVDRTSMDQALLSAVWFYSRIARVQWLPLDKYKQKCKLPPEGD